jgi:DNA repair exonuclease SbcCD ATPase subunit
LVIRVALANLSSLPKADILIVDESFGSLDEIHVPKILQLLTMLKNYFKLIVVISHIPQVKEVADHIIDIIDTGTESKVIA